MSQTIQLKRGSSANLGSLALAPGEPAVALDTMKMLVGDSNGKPVVINPDATGKADTADKLTTARTISLSGDVTGSANFDGSANAPVTATLANSGVTAGTYPKVTVDAKGRVTGGSNLTATDIPAITTAKLSDAGTLEKTANKAAANGYASLDANGKVPLAQISDTIIGQMVHAGEFNASTAVATLTANGKNILGATSATVTLTNNTTAITGYAANQGNYYVTTTAGTFASIAFAVGDWLVANASGWAKVDNTDAVTSVAGKTGAVTLAKGDVGLGSVDNTADANKTVLSAAKLTTARTIQTNLATTTAASFNGSANVTPGVTGTLPIANGGTGLTAAPSLLTNLGTTAAANVLQASPRPGITGTLGLANGGTGATSAAAARTSLGCLGTGDVIDGGTF